MPIERLSDAEYKEIFEHIVELKQYLLDMHEKIVDVQHAFIDIDRCRIEMYQIASHVARLTSWLATEEEKFQNAIKNQEGKKKEMENDRLTDKEKNVVILRDIHGKVLEEIGNIFRVTRESVRQCEARAIRNLQPLILEKVLKELYHKMTQEEKDELAKRVQTTMREDSLRLVELRDIGLSGHTCNALGRAHIETLLDLSRYSLNEISQIRWMGEKGINELCQKVKKYPDFSFKKDENGGTQ